VEIFTPFDFEFFNEPPATNAPTTNFREARISGTSMASPQVCGVGAQLLQLRPELTPTQLRDLLIEYSTDTVFTTGLDNDYTDLNTLHGAPRRVLRQPFGQPADTFKGQFQNGVQFRRR
jgi:subtilisin family serine protease